MRKSLVRYSNPAVSGTTLIIGAVLIGLLVWWLVRKKPIAGTYSNKEEWSVSYNADGLPTKIVINRNAIRS